MTTTDHAIARVDGIGHGSLPGTFTRLLELTSDGVLVVDGSGLVLHANDHAKRLLCPDGTPVGKRVTDLLSTSNGPSAEKFAGRWGTVASASSAHGQPGLDVLMPCDGSRVYAEATGSAGTVRLCVRSDAVSASDGTYLMVLQELSSGTTPSQVQRDELLDDLADANRRLTGILRIVLGTLDSQDMGVLVDRVLEELAATMGATGTLMYIAEAGGFRLRGVTDSLADATLPQYLAYGQGMEALAVQAGHALRIRVVAPDADDLRRGSVSSRVLVDEETGERLRVPTRLLPPFSSLICVPVWFGGHVIALIMVGWDLARVMARDDARLMDAIAQYLSVQIMGAITALRSKRSTELNEAQQELHDALAGMSDLLHDDVLEVLSTAVARVGAVVAPLRENTCQRALYATLPKHGVRAIPFRLDDLCEGYEEDGVAVVPFGPSMGATEVSDFLSGLGEQCVGSLVDLGELAGERRAFLALRPMESEPPDDIEVSYLHRLADLVAEAVQGDVARHQDKRIAQALQSGMRNELQDVEGIVADAVYASATAQAFVGGDFYDLIRLPRNRACVIMGDVAGHGVEAASVSAAVKTALGAYAWQGLPPAHMVRTLNRFLLGFSRLETFATLFVGVVDLGTLELTYCSAGHPPALLAREGGTVLESLDLQSGVVGAFEEMRYRDGRVRLDPGDTLLLYTDGVTEARDPQGAFYGERALREAVMAELADRGAEGLLDRLLGRLDAFTSHRLQDDVAMVELTFDRIEQG